MSNFAEIIQAHLDRAEEIQKGLRREGPELIRALQDVLDLSLNKTAREAGCSPTYLGRIMRGTMIMSPAMYLKLSDALSEANKREAIGHQRKHGFAYLREEQRYGRQKTDS